MHDGDDEAAEGPAAENANEAEVPRAPLARELGAQPIARLLATLGLSANDLVSASHEQLTHKMVQRACKGRRLTPRVQLKVRNALNARAAANYALAELFDYGPGTGPR